MKTAKSNIHRMTLLAVFTTLALAIYYVESLLPPPVPIPGIKLGLANIITLILLKNSSLKDAILVLLMRIFLVSLLFGQVISLLYSLAGGICCLIVMSFINRLLQGHFTGITGIFGAMFHNLGQLIIAILLTRSLAPIAYVPFFVICSVVTGLFTGLCAQFAHKQLQRLNIWQDLG